MMLMIDGQKYAARKFYKASETVKNWVQENYLDHDHKCRLTIASETDDEEAQVSMYTCRLEEWQDY